MWQVAECDEVRFLTGCRLEIFHQNFVDAAEAHFAFAPQLYSLYMVDQFNAERLAGRADVTVVPNVQINLGGPKKFFRFQAVAP